MFSDTIKTTRTMFTGIIEAMGLVHAIEISGSNINITMEAPFAKELKADQSVAHNGVCLTVTSQKGNCYTVTAVSETLRKSNLGSIQLDDKINLERGLVMNGRIDGHIVQGHIDQTGVCESIANQNGSWLFTFSYDTGPGNVTVEKGSVCVNGVSLTVVDSSPGRFSVAIIPYTFENTNFHALQPGDIVNLEFDVIGKYVKKMMEAFSRAA
jgi:riboflavin synthase